MKIKLLAKIGLAVIAAMLLSGCNAGLILSPEESEPVDF
jgi:hypothetical protein